MIVFDVNHRRGLFQMMKTKSIRLLGKELDQKNYPILYDWANNNPETLKNTLISIAKATDGSIGSAIQNLESDLQHG